MQPRVLIPAVLLGLTAMIGAAERVVQEVTIIVARTETEQRPAPTAVPQQGDRTYQPDSRDQNYQVFWSHPDQTFVDSDVGRLPLYTEVQLDAEGRPVPMFPSNIFAKALLDNPNEETALLYLESQRVRARRYIQASTVMQQTADKFGFVKVDDFRPPTPENTQNRSIYVPDKVTADSLGNPVLGPQGALLAGVSREEIPRTPGVSTTRDVEVVFVWDHRCAWSMKNWAQFGAVAKEVYDRQLGPRMMSVCVDNDSPTVNAVLRKLDWTSDGITKWLENYVDQTELVASMRITRTPTFLFFDRRTAKIERLEGYQTAEALRGSLLKLVGRQPEEWEKADPRWFRPVRAAPGSQRAPGAADAAADGPADSSPILPPSKPIRAWDPAGVSPN